MNKRQVKKKQKKMLARPMLVIRESGLFGGYTCPNCGNRHVREPFCRKCEQCLIYEEGQRDQLLFWKSNAEWEKVALPENRKK